MTSFRGSMTQRSLKNAETIPFFRKSIDSNNMNTDKVLFGTPRTENIPIHREYELNDKQMYQLLKNNTKKLRIFDEYFKGKDEIKQANAPRHQRRNKSDGLLKMMKHLKDSIKSTNNNNCFI